MHKWGKEAFILVYYMEGYYLVYMFRTWPATGKNGVLAVQNVSCEHIADATETFFRRDQALPSRLCSVFENVGSYSTLAVHFSVVWPNFISFDDQAR